MNNENLYFVYIYKIIFVNINNNLFNIITLILIIPSLTIQIFSTDLLNQSFLTCCDETRSCIEYL